VSPVFEEIVEGALERDPRRPAGLRTKTVGRADEVRHVNRTEACRVDDDVDWHTGPIDERLHEHSHPQTLSAADVVNAAAPSLIRHRLIAAHVSRTSVRSRSASRLPTRSCGSPRPASMSAS
jgi:hypothetical protein